MNVKFFFRLACLAMLSTCFMVSCGDDDPIPHVPTPDPDPEPQPEVTVKYTGFGCVLSTEGVAGDFDPLKNELTTVLSTHMPELKEVEPNMYVAYAVYEKGKEIVLYEKFKQLKHTLNDWWKTAHKPVVTSIYITQNETVDNVSKDWVFSYKDVYNKLPLACNIPALKNELWKTADKKQTSIESITFESWHRSEGDPKATFKTTALINETDTYNATRKGNSIEFFDSNTTLQYSFIIEANGEAIRLVKIAGQSLPETDQPSYAFNSAIK